MIKEYIEFLIKNQLWDEVQMNKSRRLDDSSLAAFAQAICEQKPKRYLEIGRSKGFSMGLVKFLSPDTEIVSMDIVPNDRIFGAEKVAQQVAALFDNITLINGTAEKPPCLLLDNELGTFDFILVDGDHSYEGAKLDLEQSLKVVNPNTSIFFDNMYLHCGNAWKELEDSRIEFKETNEEYGIIRIKECITYEI